MLTEDQFKQFWNDTLPEDSRFDWKTITEFFPEAADGYRKFANSIYEFATGEANGQVWVPFDTATMKAGDTVKNIFKGITVIGTVGHFDVDGDPFTSGNILIGELKDGEWFILNEPTKYYHLPNERPANLTDVVMGNGTTFDYIALDHAGNWFGVSTYGDAAQVNVDRIKSCNLNGTMLRRDGEFEDGEPRFVEMEEPM